MSKLIIIFAVFIAGSYGYVARNLRPNQYYLFTRSNPSQPQSILQEAISIENSNIDADKPTVILVHGHTGSAFTSLNPIVSNALLTAEDVNVIAVDWSVYARLSYSVAVDTVPVVGEELAAFITLAAAGTTPKIQLDNLHLVGFNLGAHAVGIAGRLLQANNVGTVARITGLDPSGSQWGTGSARLRIRDANYVEVIHTDGTGILANGIGTALGNVDFFANGGTNQPGCFSNACFHERAYELFAASMVNPNLIGRPCSTTTQLTFNLCSGLGLDLGGTRLSKIGAGIYRVNTGWSFPF